MELVMASVCRVETLEEFEQRVVRLQAEFAAGDAATRQRSAPPADGGRGSRRDPGLARRANAHPQSHTALRPDDAFAGPDAVRAWARGQEGRGGELPGRALCCPARRYRPAVPGVRQDPDRGAWRDRREQAAGRGTGVRARAAGILSAKPQAGRSTTPAAAKQSGGTGYADKGPTIAQGSGSSCGRVRPLERPGVISTLHTR